MSNLTLSYLQKWGGGGIFVQDTSPHPPGFTPVLRSHCPPPPIDHPWPKFLYSNSQYWFIAQNIMPRTSTLLLKSWCISDQLIYACTHTHIRTTFWKKHFILSCFKVQLITKIFYSAKCKCMCVIACEMGVCAEDVCVFFGMYVFSFLQECINILFVDHFIPKPSRTLK